MPSKCCHILAVKTKIGQPLCVYKIQNTFSDIINCANSGSSIKSYSGSKRMQQTRNSNKKIVTKEVIENQQVHTPYLMELILDKKINTDRKFKSEELQSDPSKLSKIFINEDNYDFLKVFIHKNYLFILLSIIINFF